MEQHNKIDWKKYIFSFVITAIIFATAIYVSEYFSQKKLAEVKDIQDKISIDILSSETQFSLLSESSCTDITSSSALSKELGTLETKLSYTEKDRGTNDPEVQTLKRYYSLLQIKDYLLMKKISEKCKKAPISIIYFYSNDGSCEDCEKEGYVLTKIRQDYPEMRVYSFDYNLDLSAVKTLISINNVQNKLPAIYIKGKMFYGFNSVDDIEKAIPELAKMKLEATKMASSTDKK